MQKNRTTLVQSPLGQTTRWASSQTPSRSSYWKSLAYSISSLPWPTRVKRLTVVAVNSASGISVISSQQQIAGAAASCKNAAA